MIHIEYKGKDLVRISSNILKVFNNTINIFNVGTLDILIRIHENRELFNKKIKRNNTPEWLVANASNNKEIDILSPNALKNESSHNSKEFLQIIKHELTHIFINELSKGAAIPKWLNEGLASFTAKQNQKLTEPIYLEKDFCKKLSTPKGWNQYLDYGAYQVSALFVSFLIKRYKFEKILELLSSLDKNYSNIEFNKKFKKIYGFEIKQAEHNFLNFINKK